jgi:ABC-2 type transport system ATP-binding protein
MAGSCRSRIPDHPRAGGAGSERDSYARFPPACIVNAIETEEISKTFVPMRTVRDLILSRWRRQSVVAVDRVSIHIRQGELFGILGENGAGKTTLIRMLSTTVLPTSGRASVLGHDVVREAQAVRRLIGIVSGDERSFYWRLTGRQNLEYFAALYHLPRSSIRRRIDELLAILDVEEHADRRFDGYSTGTKQRFAIARGMLADPRVLFLDEPTRALDPIAASELRRHLTENIVGRMGYTALLATHTLAEAEAICHRVAIMRAGRLVQTGTIAELRAAMALTPVLELVVDRCPPGLTEGLCLLAGITDVRVDELGGRTRIQIELAAPDRPITDLVGTVVEWGVELYSSVMREPTLDDIYRRAHG